VTRPRDFDDLVEGIESPEERERLLKVHQLLLASGPPAELPPALASSPGAPPAEDEEPDVAWLPPRRLGAALLAGAAIAGAAFGVGYIVGQEPADPPAAAPPAQPASVISLRPSDQNDTSGASINLGQRGDDGNLPMTLTVRGLEHLPSGDYYSLVLMKQGKPVVTCGTFNVAQEGATTVELVAAYDLEGFDAWAITRYEKGTHADTVVMTETA
jgi:anti-sigma-K factor RskA